MVDESIRAIRERVVREHMQSENDLDFERTLATFKHPRYELFGNGAVFDGPDEVARYYQTSREVFPDQRNEIIELHHTDEAVIVEFWLTGTHLGALGDLEPTGRSFRVRMTALFVFDGEGLVNERVYFDSAAIRRQLEG